MNRKEYNSDTRYAKVLEQMDLLGIMDVSTTRQSKNGTIVWKLPIKNQWKNGKLIEVASFESGYVRNQNSCYSNYQLNKCKPNVEYYPEWKWVYDEDGQPDHQIKTGKYNKFVGKARILIPIEIDRLEYLISYCLKNYYVAYANQVANGKFIPKWKHELELEQLRKRKEEVRDHFLSKENDCGHYERIRDLENKLDTIQRISEYGETE
jgi:hypothetical protein